MPNHYLTFDTSSVSPSRPSAALPMGRHTTLPHATISLSFPPLDGEDHSATETILEITLEDRQASRCCQHRNSLVSCLDADARLSREKTLHRERQAPVRARLTALPCHHNPSRTPPFFTPLLYGSRQAAPLPCTQAALVSRTTCDRQGRRSRCCASVLTLAPARCHSRLP